MDARSRNGAGGESARDRLERLAGDKVGGIKARVERIRQQQAQEDAMRRERDMEDAARARGARYIHEQIGGQLEFLADRLEAHSEAAKAAGGLPKELDLGVVLLSDEKIAQLFPEGKIDWKVADEKVRGVYGQYEVAAQKLAENQPKPGKDFGEKFKRWKQRSNAEKAVDTFKPLDTSEWALNDSGNLARLRHLAQENGYKIERKKDGPFVKLVAVPMSSAEQMEQLIITSGDELFDVNEEGERTYSAAEVESLQQQAYEQGAGDKEREMADAAKLEKLEAKIERMEEERDLDHKWMDKMIALMGSGRGADAEAIKEAVLKEVRTHLRDHANGAASE